MPATGANSVAQAFAAAGAVVTSGGAYLQLFMPTAAQIGAAPLNSPSFTGQPLTPTPPSGDSGTSVANTFWVNQFVAGQFGPVAGTVTTTMCASGCNFTALADFYSYATTRTFIGDSTLILAIADGTYAVAGQITIAEPRFGHVQIVGNTANPANVVLNFNNNGNGQGAFLVKDGGRLGWLDGVTLNGVGGRITSGTTWNPNSTGAGVGAFGSGSFVPSAPTSRSTASTTACSATRAAASTASPGSP